MLKTSVIHSRTPPRFLKPKAGSAVYEVILKTLVFFTLIATAISFFSIFTVYLNLGYTCRRVVRDIEITGQVTANTQNLFETLKTQTGLGAGATMQVVNVHYCNVASKKIQLRDSFAVKCNTSYQINIFTPSMGPPIGIKIPMSITLTGMSERFWK